MDDLGVGFISVRLRGDLLLNGEKTRKKRMLLVIVVLVGRRLGDLHNPHIIVIDLPQLHKYLHGLLLGLLRIPGLGDHTIHLPLAGGGIRNYVGTDVVIPDLAHPIDGGTYLFNHTHLISFMFLKFLSYWVFLICPLGGETQPTGQYPPFAYVKEW